MKPVKQHIFLDDETAEQFDVAITQSMEYGDQVVIPLSVNEDMVLIFDGINGTITGWLTS